ncbi:MAG TPA: MAB_1171c family putative transporter [Streptomyces sp.]|nr:MAB_1171c family putative transporter [Streptomyces sp.]
MLAIGSLWKVTDLIRAPHDRLLRTLVSCLLLLLTGEILTFPQVSDAIDELTTVGVDEVAYNAAHMIALYVLVFFFISSIRRECAEYRRRLWISTILLAVVLASLTICMIATPPSMRSHTLSTPHMAQPAVTGFYVLSNTYYIYAYLTTKLWVLRCARMASRHLSLGLWTMAVGLFGLMAAAIHRLVWVFLRIDDHASREEFRTLNSSVTDWALSVVLLGIWYSAMIQMILCWKTVLHHRRLFNELTPLWTALVAAYPDLVLNRRPSCFWSRRRRPSAHERFYRRLIECRDGLVRLSPYLTRVAPHADLAHGPAEQTAGYITGALALRPTVEDPDTALTAARVALPFSNDLGSDVGELLSISRALRKETSRRVSTARPYVLGRAGHTRRAAPTGRGPLVRTGGRPHPPPPADTPGPDRA